MLRKIWDGFLNLIFPPLCILCKKYLPPTDRLLQLCQDCLTTLEPLQPPVCQKCSRPLKNGGHLLCRTCTTNTPHFDQAWASLVYNDPAQRLIHLFKYREKTALRHYFSTVIKNSFQTHFFQKPDWDIIVPIPLHAARRRERGYNQAEILGHSLAAVLDIPFKKHLLVRCRPTETQVYLSQKERWTNISGAFKINHPALVQRKKILLVDDLLTTGATVSEAARILKANGASHVSVFTLAIARLEKEFE